MYHISNMKSHNSKQSELQCHQGQGPVLNFPRINFWCLWGVVPAKPSPCQQGLNSNSLVKPHSRRGVGTELRAALAVWIVVSSALEGKQKQGKSLTETDIHQTLSGQSIFFSWDHGEWWDSLKDVT